MLFGLEDEFIVSSIERLPNGDTHDVRVVIERRDLEAACPACGVLTSRVKDRPVIAVKDLRACGQRVQLWWRKRRLVCTETLCAAGSFTQTSTAIGPRARVTARLLATVGAAIASGNRAVAEVAREYQLSWPTAHRALIAFAARVLPRPGTQQGPVRVLGIDETRARSVRWVLADAGWVRSNPWMTSFVDVTPGRSGAIIGLTPGHSGVCVKDWLAAQTPAFGERVDLVVIDPSAHYASGIRAALPHARIAVDKWHLVALSNDMLTQVRQRVTREPHGRRGRSSHRVWAHRQLLLTGYEHLSDKQRTRLKTTLATEGPTNELGAAHAVKERLRRLLGEHDPHLIRRRLYEFYDAAARADMPETTRLATTINTWWPAILIALTEGVTNARTEGFNRIVKQTKRVACGFRNMDNYQRRIMVHIAHTREPKTAA